MTTTPPRPGREEFKIAILCALPMEADAVEALFDKNWEEDEKYTRLQNDDNEYSMGEICKHNVVLAFLPNIGKIGASSVATNLKTSFPGIKLGLVVGICGAVPDHPKADNPKEREEIILGDIIISKAVVQYDLGSQYSNRHVKKDTLESNLGRPPRIINSFLQKMGTMMTNERLIAGTIDNLSHLIRKKRFESWQYPGANQDRLHEPTHRHKHYSLAAACTVCNDCKNKNDNVCEKAAQSSCADLGCDTEHSISRDRLTKLAEGSIVPDPLIHLGGVASGDSLMKSGYHRDDLASKWDVIAFEMEGAGVWDAFPTIVIKGVSDYADSHKNDRWQKFAAARAAACMKAVVNEWRIAEKRASRADSPLVITSRYWKEVARAEALIDRKDKEKPVVENLEQAQEILLNIIEGHELGDLDSSLWQRVYWALMVAKKELASYKNFEDEVKIEHVKEALKYNTKFSDIVPYSSKPGLKVRVEQYLLIMKKATLKIRQGGGSNRVSEEGADASNKIPRVLKELKNKYPEIYGEYIEACNYQQHKFDTVVKPSF